MATLPILPIILATLNSSSYLTSSSPSFPLTPHPSSPHRPRSLPYRLPRTPRHSLLLAIYSNVVLAHGTKLRNAAVLVTATLVMHLGGSQRAAADNEREVSAAQVILDGGDEDVAFDDAGCGVEEHGEVDCEVG